MYSWNLTNQNNKETLSVFIDGKPKTVNSDSRAFEEVKEALKVGDWQKVSDLVDKASGIERISNGVFEVANGEVLIEGRMLPKSLGLKIVHLFDNGYPFEPFINFWRNLLENPSKRAVDCLFDFLEANPQTTFTADGCFIAYKAVDDQFRDLHSGKFNNSPGEIPKMNRNEVVEDPEIHCAAGLHVAAWGYIDGTNYKNAAKYVMVKVNPRDVVSVPNDYDFQKMRTCQYEVLKEIDRPLNAGTVYVSNSGDDYEEEDDVHYCEDCGEVAIDECDELCEDCEERFEQESAQEEERREHLDALLSLDPEDDEYTLRVISLGNKRILLSKPITKTNDGSGVKVEHEFGSFNCDPDDLELTWRGD